LPRSTFYLRTGPFAIHLETREERLREGVPLLYDDGRLIDRPEFCDFHVTVERPVLRRWFRPKTAFHFEGAALFTPSPPEHALPLFEWGLNWAIGMTVNQYLVVHAASLAWGDRALVIPGPPGAGKSTLCAGLASRGWRLLSDELTLLRLDGGGLVALARPVSLKNESIEIIRRFAPEAVFSRPAERTLKGTVALMKPPAESVKRIAEPALPAWVVVPRFTAGAAARLSPRPKAEAFLELAANAINYHVLGAAAFSALGELVDRSLCFDFAYGDLGEAVAGLTALAESASLPQSQGGTAARAT